MRIPVLALVFSLAGSIGSFATDVPPPFKVTARYLTNLALVVPKQTSNEQLKTLVLTLQKARRENKLGQILPPTTPGGSKGSYGIVVVYVYSEPEWATVAALQKCINVPADTVLAVECDRHIRAYYFYTSLTGEEEGSVGYAEGKVRTKDYQKLF